MLNMIHVSPMNVEEVIRELYDSGVRGLLLSGGFRQDGTLPIEPYVDKLRVIKRELELIISAHLGLVTSRDLLADLREIVDVVDFEFTLSSFIVNYVRGFEFSVKKYIESLEKITECGLHVVPHIYVWHPEIKSEVLREELRIISDLGLEEVTLLVYMNSDVSYKPIELSEKIVRNTKYARSIFHGKLYMGCMRPGYIKPIVDPVLIREILVDRVANPYYKAVREHPGEIYDACCSIPLNTTTRTLFTLL